MDCKECMERQAKIKASARKRERIRVNVNPDSEIGSAIRLTELIARDVRDEVRALRREIGALQRQLERTKGT